MFIAFCSSLITDIHQRHQKCRFDVLLILHSCSSCMSWHTRCIMQRRRSLTVNMRGFTLQELLWVMSNHCKCIFHEMYISIVLDRTYSTMFRFNVYVLVHWPLIYRFFWIRLFLQTRLKYCLPSFHMLACIWIPVWPISLQGTEMFVNTQHS